MDDQTKRLFLVFLDRLRQNYSSLNDPTLRAIDALYDHLLKLK